MVPDITKEIIEFLSNRVKTVCTAESFTGGEICSTLTSVSGASNCVRGGVVTYDNKAKYEFLGVSMETIDKYDVVSEEVVKQMVIGACKLFGTDYAIASTGYAEGGSDKVPVNTRYVACGNKDSILITKLCNKRGSRIDNTKEGVDAAISLFYTYITYEQYR